MVLARLAVRRLALALPGLAGVVVVTFVLNRAMPGDPAAFFAGPAATPQAIAEIRVKLGLDRSMPEQFVLYVRDLARAGIPGALDLVAAHHPKGAHPVTLTGAQLVVARHYGFRAFVVPGTWDDLEEELRQGRPVMVGLVKPELGGRGAAHFEVVVGLNRKRRAILTLDPARGLRENTAEGFAREWVPARQLTIIVLPQALLARPS